MWWTLVGILLVDCVCYWHHRLQHSFRTLSVGSLHITRHHTRYAKNFQQTETNWMPRVRDMDSSVMLITLPPLSVSIGLPPETSLAVTMSLVFVFCMHASVHNPSVVPSPLWYRLHHRRHHACPEKCFGLLSPLWDLAMGTA